jgi:tetratricopeptide (TPR) repeat protein
MEALEPAPLPPDTGAADRATAERLLGLLRRGAPVGPDDLRAAEDLHARYHAPARVLLEATLIRAAEQARARRAHSEAESFLRRAATVAPGSAHPQQALVALLLEAGDWSAAESAARAALALAPGDRPTTRGLAYALVRQDRSREAREILEEFLERNDDPSARALLARIDRDLAPEADLVERRIAHFHVRYDGEEHERVGRAILRVLERHYATLVTTLDHRPDSPISVILLSRESYAETTGAPGWSGGLYDSFDGRVRIPIGGLTPSLTPEMDDTLLHELTHAFVATISRGVAPREIHEGLAQLMEGKRVERLLDETTLAALAEGRLGGVGGFYMASLSFVEFLEGQRGQGGLNDLLKAMAETGNVNAAFEKVYRRDVQSLRRDWQARLRQRYGRR